MVGIVSVDMSEEKAFEYYLFDDKRKITQSLYDFVFRDDDNPKFKELIGNYYTATELLGLLKETDSLMTHQRDYLLNMSRLKRYDVVIFNALKYIDYLINKFKFDIFDTTLTTVIESYARGFNSHMQGIGFLSPKTRFLMTSQFVGFDNDNLGLIRHKVGLSTGDKPVVVFYYLTEEAFNSSFI